MIKTYLTAMIILSALSGCAHKSAVEAQENPKKINYTIAPETPSSTQSFFDLNETESGKHIGALIARRAIETNHDARELFILGKISSDFNPLAITIITNKERSEELKRLSSDNIRVTVEKFSTYFTVLLSPEKKIDAESMVSQLKKSKAVFSVGIFQISVSGFSEEEAIEMLIPDKNIEKAISHYTYCKKRYSGIVYRSECYNSGVKRLEVALKKGNQKFYYYKRFREAWNLVFDEKLQ